ncbi:MAG: OmpA family protein [Bacteroidota bacterium]
MKAIVLILLGMGLLVGGTVSAQTLEPTEKAALLHVSVSDFSDQPREGEVVIFRSQNSGKAVRRRTDAEGKFAILLPKGDTYAIQYQNFIEKEDYSTVEIPDEPGLMEASLEVQWEDDDDAVYELDVHFQTDKAIINPDSYRLLDELVEVMQAKPTLVIEVAGHTDSDGSAEHNLELSRNRAAAVADYLAARDVAADRVQSVGYGETKPVASNATEAGKARNRRTEVRIVGR